MKNLLNKQDQRRLKFIETLTHKKDWMILADLSVILDCSTRILKNDIVTLNEQFDEFTLHTSNKGVCIEYECNKGLKSVSQRFLAESDNYQMLEMIFQNENTAINELTERFDISISTLYRTINHLNDIMEEDYGFSIQTGPFAFTGSENKIRYFFYIYFYEKYDHAEWPFEQIPEHTVDCFTKKFIKAKNIPSELVNLSMLKVITIVNFIRFKQGEYIDIEVDDEAIEKLMPRTDEDRANNAVFEEAFDFTFNEEFVIQVFPQFVQKGIFYTYEEFIQGTEEDPVLMEQVEFLRDILKHIGSKNNISCKNLEDVVFALVTTAFLEYKQPQSEYILYDYNGHFTRGIREEFPAFYADLYDGMKRFRAKLNKPTTKEVVELYVYTVFSHWKDLVLDLRRQRDQIRVLVVSDSSKNHAEMLKDFLSYQFNEQMGIDISDEVELDAVLYENPEYDLIVSSFTDEALDDLRHIYIPSIPKAEDYTKIQEHIDEILEERLQK